MTITATKTDGQFANRFSGLVQGTFVANMTDLENYAPTESPINLGMMSDIGRATIYGPDKQENFFARYLKSPLQRGNAEMVARFSEVTSNAYDPTAAYTALFDGVKPSMTSSVAVKNLSRQIRVEVNDYVLKQYVQTPEMIGDAASAIMAASNVCYLDDMWVASKEYFTGNAGAGASSPTIKKGQQVLLNTKPGDSGFADELIETIYDISQNKFGFKSTSYNEAGMNTKSPSVDIALRKDCQYPAFKKLYSDTFHPDYLKIESSMDYVDDFATQVGAPTYEHDSAGTKTYTNAVLVGIVVDPRRWSITPMPDTLTTEVFRNQARKANTYFTTYEYAFHDAPMFNVAYLYVDGGESVS